MNKDFHSWHNTKSKIHQDYQRPNFSERDVWSCQLGINVGYEQDGKGKDFLRPVVVLRKFNKSVFLGVPLTHTQKHNQYYFHFEFQNSSSAAILSQVRLFDAKRLTYRIGRLEHKDFNQLKQKTKQLLA